MHIYLHGFFNNSKNAAFRQRETARARVLRYIAGRWITYSWRFT